MELITEEEIAQAYKIWRIRHYTFKKFEARISLVSTYFDDPIKNCNNWLTNIRKSLFLSEKKVAEKMNISQQAYSRIEKKEMKGKLTIEALRQAADAMNCDVIYYIKPRFKGNPSQVIWNQIFKAVKKHPWLKNCDPKKKAGALASISLRKMNEPEFRRTAGWSRKINYEKIEN